MNLANEINALLSDPDIEFGISIKHIESKEEINLNPDLIFPTASVFKVPVMVEVFKQSHAGKFSLDDRLELRSEDKTLTTGVLLHLQEGLKPSIRDLMMLMTIVSDNTATSMLMNLVGADNVTQTMHALGLKTISVKMTVHEMFLHAFGIPAQKNVTVKQLAERASKVQMDYDSLTFSRTPENNVSSARDMTSLMEKIFNGEIVDKEACKEMLEILGYQQFNSRIPKYLPWRTVHHKTGTMRGLRNDSGIIFCNSDSHVAFTVYTFDKFVLPLGDKPIICRKESEVGNNNGKNWRTNL